MKNINKLIIAIGITSVVVLQTTAPLRAATTTKVLGDEWFGAVLTGTFDQSTWTAGNASGYVATLTGNADGKVLKKTMNLASGSAAFALNNAGGSQAFGYLKGPGGRNLVSWNQNFQASASFSSFPFWQGGPGVDYWVGPFHVAAFTLITIKAEGYVNAAWVNGGPQLKAKFGPVASASVIATAGIGIPLLAEIGIEGSLELCRAGLYGSVDLVPYNGHLYVDYGATFEAGAPRGKLMAYAVVGRLTAPFTGWVITEGKRVWDTQIGSTYGGATYPITLARPTRFMLK